MPFRVANLCASLPSTSMSINGLPVLLKESALSLALVVSESTLVLDGCHDSPISLQLLHPKKKIIQRNYQEVYQKIYLKTPRLSGRSDQTKDNNKPSVTTCPTMPITIMISHGNQRSTIFREAIARLLPVNNIDQPKLIFVILSRVLIDIDYFPPINESKFNNDYAYTVAVGTEQNKVIEWIPYDDEFMMKSDSSDFTQDKRNWCGGSCYYEKPMNSQ
ncbi:hypothetical protein Glove_217g53 [Diversispora epigaea]|uniref:Uncharacterized protein n=1 Tax=Diversispora epigaea TaxID=1348612 RepID=A0A397IPT7_9GLOM|nr:hypothetical protein Glove_217g53 [Diversispora epigaea]